MGDESSGLREAHVMVFWRPCDGETVCSVRVRHPICEQCCVRRGKGRGFSDLDQATRVPRLILPGPPPVRALLAGEQGQGRDASEEAEAAAIHSSASRPTFCHAVRYYDKGGWPWRF
jgi:hypothetical protein